MFGDQISIPYHRWYLGILREKGVSWAGILKAWEHGIPNAWEVSALIFKRGKMVRASLEIPDLITFPLCKSSTTQPQKQERSIWQVLAEWMGYAPSSTLKRP